ncbi:laccase-like protein [Mariannaea sp. PMI_226]|nr:laccase-like protein [Mariannaea sp. PMI_226]
MRGLSIHALLLGPWLAAMGVVATTVHDSSFVPDQVLHVTYSSIPVACETRQSVVVNGTSPGPAIHLPAAGVTWIRVYNDMADQNLTMHWHGIAQRMAPFADGSPLASQWPIPPGHFFDYEVETVAGDSGTYFYHSHVGMEAMSAFGALIVDDCGPPPYHYDEERTLLLSDYFNKTDMVMVAGLTAVPFVSPGDTNAVLVNGQGIGLGHTSQPGTGPCSLPVIDVEPGKTYRFRFIGATGLSLVTLGFQDHDNLTVVQVDGGEYNAPVSVDHMQLGAGQRFDVLFQAKTAEELAAAGHPSTFYFQFETRERPTTYTGYGVLRYSPSAQVPAAPRKRVLTLPATTYNWLEYSLTPLYPEQNRAPTLEQVTRRVTINCVQLVDPVTKQTVWQLANLSWTEATLQTPVLIDIYEHGDAAVPNFETAQHNNGWDPATLTFPARVGEVLEIVLQNTGSLVDSGVDAHPFHAHGQHYFDIGSGNGTYDAVANEAHIKAVGYRPVRRDTTFLYSYESTTTPGAAAGWRAWRIPIEQPGVWMLHCHILAHMVMGMQSVWVVGDAEQIKQIPLEESIGYFTYGGDVYGNATHAPSYHEFFNSTGNCGSPN